MWKSSVGSAITFRSVSCQSKSSESLQKEGQPFQLSPRAAGKVKTQVDGDVFLLLFVIGLLLLAHDLRAPARGYGYDMLQLVSGNGNAVCY